jgi:hypothetical protein
VASHENHHFIPAAFLAEWEVGQPGGVPRLSAFACKHGQVRSRARRAKSVAKVVGLYAWRGVPAEQRNQLEAEVFQRIDNDGAIVHQRLLRNDVELDARSQSDWTRFVVSLLLRLPPIIRYYFARTPHILNGISEGDTPELAERFREVVRQLGPALPENMTLGAIRDLMGECKAHYALTAATWTIRDVSQARTDLILGDNPVLRYGPMTESHLLVLPISPVKLFIASSEASCLERLAALPDDEIVFWTNRDSAAQAYQYVYATGEHHRRLARRRLGVGTLGASLGSAAGLK